MRPADAEFAAQVADPRRHAALDFSVDSDTLLVLFGGIAGGVSMPVYEFFRVTADYPVKRLFLRDPRRAWYLRGLPGVGESADSLEAGLRQSVRESGCSRLVFAGASAGGFAALRFGARLGADAVLAFSPQTFLDAVRRQSAGDDRWADQIDDLHAALGPQHPSFDVAVPVRAAVRGTFAVHVSDDDRLDLVHATRLAEIDRVSIVEHHRGGHRLVKWLRDNGTLGPILAAALTSEPNDR